jgi:hypothetical protein
MRRDRTVFRRLAKQVVDQVAAALLLIRLLVLGMLLVLGLLGIGGRRGLVCGLLRLVGDEVVDGLQQGPGFVPAEAAARFRAREVATPEFGSPPGPRLAAFGPVARMPEWSAGSGSPALDNSGRSPAHPSSSVSLSLYHRS